MGKSNKISYVVEVETHLTDISDEIKKYENDIKGLQKEIKNGNGSKELEDKLQSLLDTVGNLKSVYESTVRELSKAKLDSEEFEKFQKTVDGRLTEVTERMADVEKSVASLASDLKAFDAGKEFAKKFEPMERRMKEFMRNMKGSLDVVRDFREMMSSKFDDRELSKISRAAARLNNMDLSVGSSTSTIDDIHELENALVELGYDYNDLEDKIKNSKSGYVTRQLQDEMSKNIRERGNILKRIAKITGDTNNVFAVDYNFQDDRIFADNLKAMGDELQNQAEKLLGGIAETKKELEQRMQDLGDVASTMATSFQFKDGGIRIPVILDPEAISKLQPQSNELIDTLNQYASKNPVDIVFRLFPMGGTRSEEKEVAKAIKDIRVQIPKTNDPELQSSLNKFVDNLEKQYQQALQLNIAINLSESASSIQAKIKTIQDEVRKTGLNISPTFQISENEEEKLKTTLKKIQSDFSFDVAEDITKMSDSLNKLLETKNISSWSQEFIKALDNIAKKLEPMKDLIEPLAELTVSKNIKGKRGRPSKETLENRSYVEKFYSALDALNKALDENKKIDSVSKELVNDVQKAVNKTETPIVIPIKPNTDTFIKEIQNAINDQNVVVPIAYNGKGIKTNDDDNGGGGSGNTPSPVSKGNHNRGKSSGTGGKSEKSKLEKTPDDGTVAKQKKAADEADKLREEFDRVLSNYLDLLKQLETTQSEKRRNILQTQAIILGKSVPGFEHIKDRRISAMGKERLYDIYYKSKTGKDRSTKDWSLDAKFELLQRLVSKKHGENGFKLNNKGNKEFLTQIVEQFRGYQEAGGNKKLKDLTDNKRILNNLTNEYERQTKSVKENTTATKENESAKNVGDKKSEKISKETEELKKNTKEQKTNNEAKASTDQSKTSKKKEAEQFSRNLNNLLSEAKAREKVAEAAEQEALSVEKNRKSKDSEKKAEAVTRQKNTKPVTQRTDAAKRNTIAKAQDALKKADEDGFRNDLVQSVGFNIKQLINSPSVDNEKDAQELSSILVTLIKRVKKKIKKELNDNSEFESANALQSSLAGVFQDIDSLIDDKTKESGEKAARYGQVIIEKLAENGFDLTKYVGRGNSRIDSSQLESFPNRISSLFSNQNGLSSSTTIEKDKENIKSLITIIQNSGLSTRDFFNGLIDGSVILDEKLKKILLDLTLIDKEGKIDISKLIQSGSQNIGGFITDNFTMIHRDRSKDLSGGTEELVEMLNEAYKSGVPVARILELIHGKEQEIFEIQETIHGNSLVENGSLNPRALQMTNKELFDMLVNLQKIHDSGLIQDENMSNIIIGNNGAHFIDNQTITDFNPIDEKSDYEFENYVSDFLFSLISEIETKSEDEREKIVEFVKKIQRVLQDNKAWNISKFDEDELPLLFDFEKFYSKYSPSNQSDISTGLDTDAPITEQQAHLQELISLYYKCKQELSELTDQLIEGNQDVADQVAEISVRIQDIKDELLRNGLVWSVEKGDFFPVDEMKKEAVEAVEESVDEAKDATADAQKSKSPSIVAQELGEYWGIGYAEGIKLHKDDVADAVRELIKTGKLTTQDLIDDQENIKSDELYTDLVKPTSELIDEKTKLAEGDKITIWDGNREIVYDTIRDIEGLTTALENLAKIMQSPVFHAGFLTKEILNSKNYEPADNFMHLWENPDELSSPGSGIYVTSNPSAVVDRQGQSDTNHTGKRLYALDMGQYLKSMYQFADDDTIAGYQEIIESLTLHLFKELGNKQVSTASSLDEIYKTYEEWFKQFGITFEQLQLFEKTALQYGKEVLSDPETASTKVNFGTLFAKQFLNAHGGLSAGRTLSADSDNVGSVLFGIDKQHPFGVDFGNNEEIFNLFSSMLMDKLLTQKAMSNPKGTRFWGESLSAEAIADMIIRNYDLNDVPDAFRDKLISIIESGELVSEKDLNAALFAPSKIIDAVDAETKKDQKSNSPSKVAELLGGDWGKGYANGILKSEDDVREAVKRLVETGKITAEELMKDLANIVSEEKYKDLLAPATTVSILASSGQINQISNKDASKQISSYKGQITKLSNQINKKTDITPQEFAEMSRKAEEYVQKLKVLGVETSKIEQSFKSSTQKVYEKLFPDKKQADESTEGVHEEKQALDQIPKSANDAAQGKEKFADANSVLLSSIVESLKGLKDEADGLNNLNKLINNLSGSNSGDKVQKVVKGLTEIYKVLNQDTGDNALIKTLTELANKGTDLQNLATVLKASKKEISNARKAVDTSQQDNLKSVMESVDVSGNARGYLEKFGEVVNLTKEIKNGFIQITSTVLTADDEFKRYTLSTKTGIDMTIAKVEEHTTGLEKEVLLYTKLLKASQNLNKVSPNQTDEVFIEKDSQTWKDIISYAKEYGEDLGNILPITRSVRQVNDELLESFKIVGENGSVTIGAENDVVGSIQNIGNLTKEYRELNSVMKQLQELSSSADFSEKYTQDYQGRVRSIIDQYDNSSFDVTNENSLKIMREMLDLAKQLKREQKDNSNIIGNVNQLEKIRQKTSDILNDYQAMPRSLKRAFEDLRERTKHLIDTGAVKEQVDEISSEFMRLNGDLSESGKKYQGIIAQMFERLRSQSTQLLAQYFSFRDILRYGRQAITTIIDLDTQLVDLRKTTKMNSSELNEFYHSAADVAKELGVTTSEIISQASAWSRLGYSTKEASTEMAKLSSQFASVSPEMTTEQSTDYLVSTMKAFGISVDETSRKIMDNVNRIGKTLPKHMVTYGAKLLA